jgi:hypothetical protein
MGDVPWQAVFSEDLVPTVLSGTDFGQDWIARSILAVMLAAALLAARPARAYYRPCLIVACVLASGLTGTLAWAGHAAGTGDGLGVVHIASDILHLVVAGAWVGALLPLALVLGAALVRPDTPSIAIARKVVLRFSTLGVACVGMLVITGVFNSWVIVGSLTGLRQHRLRPAAAVQDRTVLCNAVARRRQSASADARYSAQRPCCRWPKGFASHSNECGHRGGDRASNRRSGESTRNLVANFVIPG